MISTETSLIEHSHKRKFAIVRLWPNIQTAETENIERFKITAKKLGLECIEITEHGKCVKTGRRITAEDVDFAIHLHFSTPKLYDIFSFVALWNPLRFYYDWGYQKYSRYLVTHDDFLSCNSKMADDHVNRMILTDPLHDMPHFEMFHSLSEPIFPPRIMERKIFYIGINWEKITNQPSRHTELLKKLDETDNLEIYGPRLFQGKNVWADFKSYVSDIPFDGISVIKVIAKVGVALVFSSDAHRASQLMSNRLFEALAAGAVIICDENQFAKKYFGDTILYVHSKSPTLYNDVSHHLDWLNRNPEKAYEMACKSQKIFKEKFSLDRSIAQIYKNLSIRRNSLQSSTFDEPSILVIFLFINTSKESLENFHQLVKKQNYKNIHVLAVRGNCTDNTDVCECENIKTKSISYIKIDNFAHHLQYSVGSIIFDILSSDTAKSLKYEYFCIMTSNEYVHHNHFSALVNLGEKAPEFDIFSTTGILTNSKSHHDYLLTSDIINFFTQNNQPIGFCRFLFRKDLLDKKNHIDIFLPYLHHNFIAAFAKSETEIKNSLLVTCEINCKSELYVATSEDAYIQERLVIKDFYQIPETQINPLSAGERVLNFIKHKFMQSINNIWPSVRTIRNYINHFLNSIKKFLKKTLELIQV